MPYILGHIKINCQVQWVINIPRNPNFLARGTSCKRSYLVDSLNSHCISVFLAVFLYFKAVRQAPPCSRSWPGWWLTHVGGDCQIARLGMSHSHWLAPSKPTLSLHICHISLCCLIYFLLYFLIFYFCISLRMSHSHWIAPSKATLSLHICQPHISLLLQICHISIFSLFNSFNFHLYLLMCIEFLDTLT